MNVIEEHNLKIVIKQKIAEGIPEEFLPKVKANPYQPNQAAVYTGPPPRRTYKVDDIPHRMKTYEEFKRIFEKVPQVKIQIEADDHTGDQEWYYKMEQLDYERYDSPSFDEWDGLWTHSLSEQGVQPMDWPME